MLDFAVASVVYATGMAMLFRLRIYYAAFSLAILLASGSSGLVLAPALWLLVELLSIVMGYFRSRVILQ